MSLLLAFHICNVYHKMSASVRVTFFFKAGWISYKNVVILHFAKIALYVTQEGIRNNCQFLRHIVLFIVYWFETSKNVLKFISYVFLLKPQVNLSWQFFQLFKINFLWLTVGSSGLMRVILLKSNISKTDGSLENFFSFLSLFLKDTFYDNKNLPW